MRSQNILLVNLLGLCLIMGVLLLNTKHSEEKLTIIQDIDYTFYQIEIEWPGSVCKFYNCTNKYLADYDGSTFNLHGVWATGQPTNQCKYDNNCQDIPFDNSLISHDLQSQLNQYWVGLYNPTETFHQHEWEKHGVCWNDNINPIYGSLTYKQYINDYFALGVNVVTSYNPLPIWNDYGIVPSDTQGYDYELVIAALVPEFGEGVVGQCKTVNGQQLLHSLDFCLGLDYVPIGCLCANAEKSSCDSAKPVFLGQFVRPNEN